MIGKGFKVLRLWEHEVNLMENPKQLYEQIDRVKL